MIGPIPPDHATSIFRELVEDAWVAYRLAHEAKGPASQTAANLAGDAFSKAARLIYVSQQKPPVRQLSDTQDHYEFILKTSALFGLPQLPAERATSRTSPVTIAPTR